MAYLQWANGLMSDAYWSFGIRYVAKSFFAFPGAQDWWQIERALFSSEYRSLVDALIAGEIWKDPDEFIQSIFAEKSNTGSAIPDPHVSGQHR
jgi:hypothetical protein